VRRGRIAGKPLDLELELLWCRRCLLTPESQSQSNLTQLVLLYW
jgi:hypothetical protein